MLVTTSANEVVIFTYKYLTPIVKPHNQFKHTEHALSTVFNR